MSCHHTRGIDTTLLLFADIGDGLMSFNPHLTGFESQPARLWRVGCSECENLTDACLTWGEALARAEEGWWMDESD